METQPKNTLFPYSFSCDILNKTEKGGMDMDAISGAGEADVLSMSREDLLALLDGR